MDKIYIIFVIHDSYDFEDVSKSMIDITELFWGDISMGN
jgi:hypothetical protein